MLTFIKSSLLRSVFIACCQLNNIKLYAWWIKKMLQKKKVFNPNLGGEGGNFTPPPVGFPLITQKR